MYSRLERGIIIIWWPVSSKFDISHFSFVRQFFAISKLSCHLGVLFGTGSEGGEHVACTDVCIHAPSLDYAAISIASVCSSVWENAKPSKFVLALDILESTLVPRPSLSFPSVLILQEGGRRPKTLDSGSVTSVFRIKREITV